jgi:hypothetical protein
MSQGIPGYVISSSSNPTAGQVQVRVTGPLISGHVADNVSSGPGPLYSASPAGLLVIQSTASVTNQIITTGDTVVRRSAFIYIPVAGVLVSSSAGFEATAPPYTGAGAAMCWNDDSKRLMIWSSGTGSWLATPAAAAFTCSS